MSTKPKKKITVCPCCGHLNPSKLLRCQACDLVKGQDDPARRLTTWTQEGMKWSSFVTKQPKNWNPLNTLGRLALSVTQAKTRGRPPRMN